MNVNAAAQLAGVGTISTTGDSLYYKSTAASTFAARSPAARAGGR